ncbi:MAG: type IV pilus biogenesis/stability protein PilW [Proteobacteria bacterium]|nr:type IV pilus biogenesis/stability protein PilW [Pseudomonadota bacterium]HQR04530.1 type IV pilus biogenesis/stability protein PilW [Rhodocyclaceae bacterium]
MRLLLICLLSLLLAACAGGGGDPGARTAASAQPTTSKAQARAKSHTDLGLAYLDAGQMVTALDEARIALASDSSYAPAYNLLGLVYGELRETREATQSFERALQLAPGDPEISNNYGWFLCQNKEPQKAMGYFQAAIRNPLYSAPAVALTNAAACAQSMNDEKGAEEYLIRALRYDPGSARALYMLADNNYRQGRYNEARLRMADLLSRADATPAALWLSIRIARHLGERIEEARYSTQLRRFPNSPEYLKLTQGQSE